MSGADVATALALIEAELQHVPESAREAVADRVLGALTGQFYLFPRPPEEATQAPARGGRPSA